MLTNINTGALIADVVAQQLSKPDFMDYCERLDDLGVVRFYFDACTNTLNFFSTKERVHSMVVTELSEACTREKWRKGAELDEEKLAECITLFDEKAISTIEFHRQLYAAGVVFAQVFLAPRKIFYFDEVGQFFLEEF